MTPIGLILLFLTGVGPLLAWRKSTIIEPARSVPVAAREWRIAVGATVAALGVRVWGSGLCFALCALRVRRRSLRSSGAAPRVRQRATGTDLFTALVGLFAARGAVTAATSSTSASC